MAVPRQFAISDIHGCNITFGNLLDQIAFSTSDELYILGDLIDRGPDSKGVFDRVFQMQEEGYQVHCLRGNHEQLFLDAVNDEEWAVGMWESNGGIQTMRSFGAMRPSQVPMLYRSFMAELPYYFELEEYVLVHAGLNLKRHFPLMDPKSMMWIRRWYGDFEDNRAEQWLDDRIIVHGHTPIPNMKTAAMLQKIDQLPVINIDNGCVFAGKQVGLGTLCAFDLTHQQLFWEPFEG